MATVKDVLKSLEAFAPPSLKMDFDNVGFLVGFSEKTVNKILVSLDITDAVIDEAIAEKADLIVSHHPLFFSLKSVTDDDKTGRKVTKLLANGLSAICMHTNLDAATGGVNDTLAETAGLTQISLLHGDVFDENGTAYSYGRVGYLGKPVTLEAYLEVLKSRLNTAGLRYHDAKRAVCKVATVGGSGGSELKYAIAHGCDTFVTADIKYDVFLEAKEAGINMIDADHFCTENVVTPIIEGKLREIYPNIAVSVSNKHCQTARFY